MERSNYLFTSESVSEGHPDKVCDRVSDAIVDTYLAADPQARVAVESRSNIFDVRSEKYKSDEPISLYFAVRRYPKPGPDFNLLAAYQEQCRIAEQMMFERIIPNFAQPLNSAIAQRR